MDDLDAAFADDLTLIAASTNPRIAEEHLERKLSIFSNFLQTRGMEAAFHKLKTMSLDPHGRNYSPRIRFQGKFIEVVTEHRFLGIVFDKDMSFVKHWELVYKAVTNRIKAMGALRSAKWGPTQQTLKVVHHCYVESRIRYGILAWYPFLDNFYRNKLEVLLRRSIRIAIGLPMWCWNKALIAEADLDTVTTLAQKSAVSFYVRINPEDKTQMTLAKRRILEKKPEWTRLLTGIPSGHQRKAHLSIPKYWKGLWGLKGVPESIWQGPIQVTLSNKIILTSEAVQVVENTFQTQRQAEEEENKYKRILYTDASVAKNSDPQGQAATGYIWYQRSEEGRWEEIAKSSANIGHGHSSYSAEAIAIRLGLENEPPKSESSPDANSGDTLEVDESAADVTTSTAPRPEIGIFTDSLSNLCTIRKGIAQTPEQEKLLRTIVNSPNIITFHHVRAHQDNIKNNNVDKLCNIYSATPDRRDAKHLGGLKTASKIKQWTQDWFTERRVAAPLQCNLARSRNSETQRWIERHMTDTSGRMILRPKMHNHLPRRKGILLVKARTFRWTNCNWFLKKIQSRNCKDCANKEHCRKCMECTRCKVKDDTDHVLNSCELHEGPRSLMLQRLGHHDRVSTLLTSSNVIVVRELAEFLVGAEDLRLQIQKENKEREEQQKRKSEKDSRTPGCQRNQGGKGVASTTKTSEAATAKRSLRRLNKH